MREARGYEATHHKARAVAYPLRHEMDLAEAVSFFALVLVIFLAVIVGFSL